MSAFGTQVQSVVLAVLLATAGLAPASLGVDAMPPSDGETTFHLSQNGDCYEFEALGDGNITVEEFYDYRSPDTDPAGYTYSSHGTQHLQDNQVSNVFVYRGTEGYSLVMVHDEMGDAPYGSTVTFELSGLPTDREWVVEDDAYAGRDDEFDHGATGSTITWKWAPNRTDGAAVRGLADDDYEAVTIDPGFNEDASAWGDWHYSGGDHRIHDWRLLDADGSAVSLDMDQSVSIAPGGCDDGDGGDDETTTTTSTTTTETTTGTETPTETITTTETETTTAEPSTTTQTTTDSGTTTETEQTTAETTRTTTETTTTSRTTTTSENDDSNDGDDSNGGDGGGDGNDGDDGDEKPLGDEDSDSGQSGGFQGSTQQNGGPPERATAKLADADGRFGNVTLEADESGTTPEIRTRGATPESVRAPATERDGFAALSYLDAAADDGTATVTLSADRLESAAAAASEVALFRFENGSWTAVETEQVSESDETDSGDSTDGSAETVCVRADVTTGIYAVGIERPALGIADLAVAGGDPSVGESVEVVAAVENRGLADGNRTVAVAVDGETVATRNVSVPAGSTHEVVVTHAFESVGDHAVEVGDERASVTVAAVETTEDDLETNRTETSISERTGTAETDATSLAGDATSDDSSQGGTPGVPGFGVGVALAALAGAVLVVLRRA